MVVFTEMKCAIPFLCLIVCCVVRLGLIWDEAVS